MDHMKTDTLLYRDQQGFMECRSCMTQLLSAMEAWTEALDSEHCIDTIYFHFQKAFVPHEKTKQDEILRPYRGNTGLDGRDFK